MTGRHKLVFAETSVLRQETNTTVPRLARSLQDSVKAEMTKRARARRASPKRLTILAKGDEETSGQSPQRRNSSVTWRSVPTGR
jgi:hypothetical protein